LPKELPDPYHLCNTTTTTLAFADRTHKAKIKLEFERPAGVLLQDARKFNNDTFNAFIWIQNGNIPKNQIVSLRFMIAGAGQIDDTPAHLSLDEKSILGRTWGNGGSYCFGQNSPIAEYTFKNLDIALSRTEMSLREWEPENDNDDPTRTNWQRLKEHDTPGSNLHAQFEMMRQLSRKKIPFITSIWYLPKWMYLKPEETEYNNQLAPDKWPELLESIGSYLLYAKEKYHAEPDYFSFNEPDGGVHVLFSAEEHRDAIKRIGAHLAKLKLKTKLLLGDVTNPRGTVQYCMAAAKDPDAMKYVGALSFHSWGGAKPEQYAEWPALAKRLKLPLICAEAGPDPDWNTQPFFKPDAHAAEMTHYLEIFRHAQPQAVIYWEFSDNFPLLRRMPESEKLAATERFGLQKHFCDLALPGGEGVETQSDNDAIVFAAFKRRGRKGADDFTLHVANTKWARRVTISGIPDRIKMLEIVRTAKGEIFKRIAPLAVIDGKLELDLPEQSLTTLTTQPIPGLRLP
jgi:O-glycosyl hydrolase